MPNPYVSSHGATGTTFEFDGDLYSCVDISHEQAAPSRERVDMTTLDVADGEEMVMYQTPLKPKRDPAKFTIQFKSKGTVPVRGTEATLTTADGSGTYRCTNVSISRKTNTYVEGSASFEELIDDEAA